MLGIGLGLTGRGRPYGSAIVAWTPLDLGAALKAWWSADDHGTARMVDDGAGLISSWTDKVGAMAVTATTTARPTWAATSFNSAYAGLTFDGTANCLASIVLTTLPTGATAGELWGLAHNNVPGSSAAARIAVAYGGAVNNTRGLYRFGVSTVSRFRFSDGTVFTTDTVTSLDAGAGHILSASFAGTTQAGRVDGADANPASAVITTLATQTTRLRIGAFTNATAASFWSGVIRHVFVTTTLTGTEREKLEGWMAHNSGLASVLPGGHPYKLAPP